MNPNTSPTNSAIFIQPNSIFSQPQDPTPKPIIINGGTIHDVKSLMPADEERLVALEARMCGNSIT